MNQRKRKICLITPNHISTNPRLVKEAIALEKYGYDVHLIFTQSTAFESGLDFALLQEHPSWSYDVLDWSNKSLTSRLIRTTFGFIQKLATVLFNLRKSSLASSIITNRNYFWQLFKAKQVKADLYIAHNLGALPVARKAGNSRGVKVGFDAEDFHRHETSDDVTEKTVVIKSLVENNNIPGIDHYTAASPLIAKAYQKLFTGLKATVILNVFPQPEIAYRNIQQKHKLKLFWFSQTVGPNRGIEQMVEAISLLEAESCELHLLGNAHSDFKNKIEDIANKLGLTSAVIFHAPCPEKEIFSIAATCDIGLASETGVPYNRDICLTNKIFTYIQSGLAVAASNTLAQSEFLNCYPSIGKLYDKTSAESLAEVIQHYQINKDELENCKRNNLQLAKDQVNWAHEQTKFIAAVESTFANAVYIKI